MHLRLLTDWLYFSVLRITIDSAKLQNRSYTSPAQTFRIVFQELSLVSPTDSISSVEGVTCADNLALLTRLSADYDPEQIPDDAYECRAAQLEAFVRDREYPLIGAPWAREPSRFALEPGCRTTRTPWAVIYQKLEKWALSYLFKTCSRKGSYYIAHARLVEELAVDAQEYLFFEAEERTITDGNRKSICDLVDALNDFSCNGGLVRKVAKRSFQRSLRFQLLITVKRDDVFPEIEGFNERTSRGQNLSEVSGVCGSALDDPKVQIIIADWLASCESDDEKLAVQARLLGLSPRKTAKALHFKYCYARKLDERVRQHLSRILKR